MDRRQYLKRSGGLALGSTVPFAGCVGGGGTGILATRVSDQPGDIGDFESCVVYIDGIWAKPVDEELIKTEIEEQSADLTDLQGEQSRLLEEVELNTGTYEFLQLKVTRTEATLDDGSDATVSVPGDAPLKFNTEFEIRDGETTTFIADFTPVQTGQASRYLLQPVANEVEVIYESEATTTQ